MDKENIPNILTITAYKIVNRNKMLIKYNDAILLCILVRVGPHMVHFLQNFENNFRYLEEIDAQKERSCPTERY